MKVILGYSRYGVEIDVPNGASKNEMIQAYLRAYGGPEDIFDHFFAILPQFGIRAHETPTGNDIRWLKEPERKLKEES